MLVLIKKFAWSNITAFQEKAEKIASDIDRAEEARQKAGEYWLKNRKDELAGSRKEIKTIIENAETAEKSKASILADAKLEARTA